MCERMHGHNWRVRATVRVEEHQLDANGMGIDFRVIEQTIRTVVSEFEHRYLNDLEPFSHNAPTAEFIAKLIARRSSEQLEKIAPTAKVHQVEVWETPHYRVAYNM